MKKIVKLCLEDSKRLLAKPVQKKKLPITVDMLKKIIDRIGKRTRLYPIYVHALCVD
jgi:hypothetical protein